MNKISFAFTIAVIAVGITVASYAKKKIDNKEVTACFINIAVTDGTSDVIITESVNCINAKILIHYRPYLISASSPSSYPSENSCPPSNVSYCCVKLTETTDARARLIDLGEGLKRYKVNDSTDVFCKP